MKGLQVIIGPPSGGDNKLVDEDHQCSCVQSRGTGTALAVLNLLELAHPAIVGGVLAVVACSNVVLSLLATVV